jgi:hypothetical protein
MSGYDDTAISIKGRHSRSFPRRLSTLHSTSENEDLSLHRLSTLHSTSENEDLSLHRLSTLHNPCGLSIEVPLIRGHGTSRLLGTSLFLYCRH